MKAFHCTPDGRLDRQYLRTCAVYRLLKGYRIDKTRAVELLKARRVPVPNAVVEMWLNGPLSERGRQMQIEWRRSMS